MRIGSSPPAAVLQHEGLGGEQTGRRRGAQTVLAHTEGEAHVLGIGRELGIGEGVVSLVALLGHHRSVVRAGDVLVQVVEAEVDDALLAQRVEVFTQHEEAVVVFVGGRGGHLQPGAHVVRSTTSSPRVIDEGCTVGSGLVRNEALTNSEVALPE